MQRHSLYIRSLLPPYVPKSTRRGVQMDPTDNLSRLQWWQQKTSCIIQARHRELERTQVTEREREEAGPNWVVCETGGLIIYQRQINFRVPTAYHPNAYSSRPQQAHSTYNITYTYLPSVELCWRLVGTYKKLPAFKVLFVDRRSWVLGEFKCETQETGGWNEWRGLFTLTVVMEGRDKLAQYDHASESTYVSLSTQWGSFEVECSS